jgi:hypothetical protein
MRASRLLLTITAAAAAAAAVAGISFALAPALDHSAPERSPAAGSAVAALRPGATAARRVTGKAVLRVTDVQGVNVLEMDGAAAAPTDVQLPAGNYRVSARFNGRPRSETVEVISVPEQELATR